MGWDRGWGWPPGLRLPPRSPGPPGVGLVPVLAALPFPLTAAGLRVHRWKGGVGPDRHTALACLAAGCHRQRHPSPAVAVAECPPAALLDTRPPCPPAGCSGQGPPHWAGAEPWCWASCRASPILAQFEGPHWEGDDSVQRPPPSTLPSNVTQEVCSPCSRFPLARGADGCSSRRNHSRLLWPGGSWSCRCQSSALYPGCVS